MYNNFSNLNYNYNIPVQNNMNHDIYNPYGLNNDQNYTYNQNPYQYIQGAPINNINRNLIHSNSVSNITPNKNINNNPNFPLYNNNYNPVLSNIGYQNPVYPISNIPNTYNQLNPIDLIRNNSKMSNQPILSNTNEPYSKRQIDKMRSISSNYRGDLSAINEISNNDNSYAGDVQNTSKTNNFNKKRYISNTGTLVNGVYTPYSLDDYKKIANVKIELGSLGPNIGTKEWEERQEKMKKMEEYSNKVKNNKLVIKLKKETPIELIEKEKIIKKENSNRNKAYRYDSLVREKVVKINSNQNINLINEYNEGESKNVDVSRILNKYNNENNELKYNYKEFKDNNLENNPIKRNKSSGRLRKYNNLNENIGRDDNDNNNNKNSNENKYNHFNKNINDNLFSNNIDNNFIEKRNNLNKIEDEFNLENIGKFNINSSDENNNGGINFRIKEVENESDIEKIQRQRQTLASKINEIKESFL